MPRKGIVRRRTNRVMVGPVAVGGESPVTVQTMWKNPIDLQDPSLPGRIDDLTDLGCDILRFSVPHLEAAASLGQLIERVRVAIVADIHFDYRIALRCMDWPVAKIRVNPGNIGAKWKVEEVARKAKDRKIPIRVGINAGSLPKGLRGEVNVSGAMVKAAEEEMLVLQKLDFHDVIFSLKSSSIETTVEANTIFSEKYAYPLHLGLTEAGPLVPGLVRSTTAIGALLRKGIGDTLRVSLSDSPDNEVRAGVEILKIYGLGSGVQIVSCPTCGRTVFDVTGFLEKAEPFLAGLKKDLVISIMGCPVNGPGEAKNADIGITGSEKYAVIFRGGNIVRRVPIEEALQAFKEEVLREDT